MYSISTKKENQKEAFYWYSQAVKQGVIIARNNLGTMYFFGYGTKKALKKDFHYYSKASESNNAVAQTNLAMMYFVGEAIGKDLDKTKYWLDIASKSGNKKARMKLADMYRMGNYIDKDYKRAFDLYVRGIQKLCYYVGYAYLRAFSVKKYLYKYKVWMTKAKKLNHKRSSNFLETHNL